MIEYADYTDIFVFELRIKLFENSGINKYIIILVKSKQLWYGPIYIFSLMKLEILKIYTKTQQIIGCIKPFKSFKTIFILLDKKPNGSFCLYIIKVLII